MRNKTEIQSRKITKPRSDRQRKATTRPSGPERNTGVNGQSPGLQLQKQLRQWEVPKAPLVRTHTPSVGAGMRSLVKELRPQNTTQRQKQPSRIIQRALQWLSVDMCRGKGLSPNAHGSS